MAKQKQIGSKKLSLDCQRFIQWTIFYANEKLEKKSIVLKCQSIE